jgi:hypothetical protein
LKKLLPTPKSGTETSSLIIAGLMPVIWSTFSPAISF